MPQDNQPPAHADKPDDTRYLQTILDSSFSGIMAFESLRDVDGRIIDFVWTMVNRRAGEMTNHEPASLIGQRLLEVMPGNREEGLFDLYVDVVQTGQPLEHEHYYEHDGIKTWFRTTAVKLDDGFVVTFSDITIRKNAEQALKDKHAELQNFFDASLDMLCITETDGKIIKSNKRWDDMLGFIGTDLTDTRLLELVHPDDLAEVQQATAKLSAGESVIGLINRFRAHDGDYRWIEWRAYLAHNRVYLTAQDVTERQTMQTRLRDSEAIYRALFEQSNDAIFLIGLDGKHMRVNQRACEMFGYDSPDEMLRLGYRDLVVAEEHHGSDDVLRRLITGQRVLPYERTFQHRDGSYVNVSVSVQLVRDVDGKPLHIQSICRDISQRKIVEGALRQNEARMRSLLENMRDVVWAVEWPSGQLIYINPVVEEIYGHSIISFYHDKNLWYEVIHPEDKPTQREIAAKLLADGWRESEYRIIRPDGEVRWLRERQWLVYDDDGGPTRVEGITSDITERKVAAERQIQLRLERERKNLLRSFIEKTSHEFRTPLSIINTSQYLMTRADSAERRAQMGGRIEGEVRYINNLIDMLLEVVKLETTSDKTHHKPVNPLTLLRSVCADIEILTKGAAITCDIPDDLPTIYGASVHLQDMMRHIMHNARRYTPDDGYIKLEAQVEANRLMIRVSDNGVGISPDDLPRIFDMFWRKDEARTTPGMGLGLSIAQKIAELHDGEIHIESELERGTVVTVYLPLS